MILKLLMITGLMGLSSASILQNVEDTADLGSLSELAEEVRQFTVLTSTTGLPVVALNASTAIVGAILIGGLSLLAGIALGALQSGDLGDMFASGRRDEEHQYADFETNEVDTSYVDMARRSLEALNPVLSMLTKAYTKYG